MKKKPCVHYWLIEPPYGKTSKAICKLCGNVGEFMNYIPDFTALRYKPLRKVAKNTSTIYTNSEVAPPKVFCR